eukprot:5980803-Amphidinium_carterae.1
MRCCKCTAKGPSKRWRVGAESNSTSHSSAMVCLCRPSKACCGAADTKLIGEPGDKVSSART